MKKHNFINGWQALIFASGVILALLIALLAGIHYFAKL
jgi:hypothetical protein